jgi:hypothetical protein
MIRENEKSGFGVFVDTWRTRNRQTPFSIGKTNLENKGCTDRLVDKFNFILCEMGVFSGVKISIDLVVILDIGSHHRFHIIEEGHLDSK